MKTNYKSEINGLYQVHKFFSRQDISKLINHDKKINYLRQKNERSTIDPVEKS